MCAIDSSASPRLVSTLNSTNLFMSEEMQSYLDQRQRRPRRSMLASSHPSRMTQTTRHSPRVHLLALRQFQSFGSQPSVTTWASRKPSPNVTRVLSNTSLMFVFPTFPTTNPNPASRSASTSVPTNTSRMRCWTRLISTRRKWAMLATLSMTVRSAPRSSGRRTKT